MSGTVRREPWIHTWTDEAGIHRQTQVHYTHDDRSVVWAPRFTGDPQPWFDGDRAEDDPSARYEDEDLVTRGDPTDPHFGEVDPDFDDDLDIDI
ncbi:hypothetical protein [Streptomyces sp. RLA2-12]|uniref:hypothetical protein n=1 Tax=Streptomyces sp. RLA2-12 TaxID=2721242 RepID=UPI00145EA742|nr:hypothetical protein [Streptomyces sp. RLA2-12]NMI63145.1 hypothetical protein [Streptomyces sp. RLA2-12]